MRFSSGTLWLLGACVVIASHAAREPSLAQDRTRQPQAAFRGPIELLVRDDGNQLLTVNRRSGTILLLNPLEQKRLGEFPVGKKLSSAARLPGTPFVTVTDEESHELLLIHWNNDRVEVVSRIATPLYPVKVVCQADGRRCCVASLWSRQVSFFDIDATRPQPACKLVKTISLPFAPRELALAEEMNRLIVADAFGGYLATIDLQQQNIVAVREIPAHNLRGLATSPDGQRLYVAHQILNGLARTTPDDIHWGMLMGNVIRSLDLKDLEDAAADLPRASEVYPIGDAWKGGADPGRLQLLSGGRIAVAFGGTGEVGVLDQGDYRVRRIVTLPHPTALGLSPEGNRLYVCDELADSVAILDLDESAQLADISLGPQPELTIADRGERLFYNGDLSHGGWMSCHSCHPDGHSNGLLNDNLGDGHFGAPKRVLSLLGVGKTGSWAWNGGVAELQAQVKKSIETTMRGREPTDEQVVELTAFLKTLAPPPPGDLGRGDSAAISRGNLIFVDQGCARCHAAPEYTTDATYEVGLEDEAHDKAFNPPSLRGVGHRDHLFHDNRAKNLDDVFVKFNHQLEKGLSDADRHDLIAFLRSL